MVHIEDMLARIMSLLKSSNAIQNDPTEGKLSRLFFDRPLSQLQSQNFYPGMKDRESLELENLPRSTISNGTRWFRLVAGSSRASYFIGEALA